MDGKYRGSAACAHVTDSQSVDGITQFLFQLGKDGFGMTGADLTQAGGFLGKVCCHVGGAADTDT